MSVRLIWTFGEALYDGLPACLPVDSAVVADRRFFFPLRPERCGFGEVAGNALTGRVIFFLIDTNAFDKQISSDCMRVNSLPDCNKVSVKLGKYDAKSFIGELLSIYAPQILVAQT
jgi:hypothetical protein